jgi:sigma-E factor negative regulatory protein RseB
MRHACAACAFALFLGPAPALADAASDWLLKVSDASRQANYQGVVVFRDGQRMDVSRLVHRQRDGRVQERLTALTGRARDILREGDDVFVLAGDERLQASAPPILFPILSRDRLAEAETHYEVRDLGRSRVAGRPCRGVMLAPRDEFRYGYEVCGDVETAVPLRVTLLDGRGRTIEQLLFTEVSFPAQIPDTAFAPPPGVTPKPMAAAAPAPAPAPPGPSAAVAGTWRLVQLPPGFRIVRRDRAPSPDGQGMVEHVLLSDGLSAVSVFAVRPLATGRTFSGLSNMGAMSAYGRRVGAFHVTVIGEVPASTVRMIGDGVAPPPDAPADATAPAPAAAPAEPPEDLTK